MTRTETYRGEYSGSQLTVIKDRPWGHRDDPKLYLEIGTENGIEEIYLAPDQELRLLKFLLER